MSPEQALELALKWHKKWFSMLEAEAEKGGIKEAEALMDDNAIIELFFARSEQAIRELDDQYGRTCHKLSYNILNSCQDAEECVNDAYLGTWNAIPPTRPSPLLALHSGCDAARSFERGGRHPSALRACCGRARDQRQRSAAWHRHGPVPPNHHQVRQCCCE